MTKINDNAVENAQAPRKAITIAATDALVLSRALTYTGTSAPKLAKEMMAEGDIMGALVELKMAGVIRELWNNLHEQVANPEAEPQLGETQTFQMSYNDGLIAVTCLHLFAAISEKAMHELKTNAEVRAQIGRADELLADIGTGKLTDADWNLSRCYATAEQIGKWMQIEFPEDTAQNQRTWAEGNAEDEASGFWRGQDEAKGGYDRMTKDLLGIDANDTPTSSRLQ